mgnify:FL=1
MNDRGWNDHLPSDYAKSIMIEGAELLENFQWDNFSAEAVKKDAAKMESIKKELADVMIYCFDLAVILNIDVQKALDEKLKKNILKYPKELFNPKNRAKGVTEKEYWEIKKKYRKEGKN